MLQLLCKNKLGWDDEVSRDLKDVWFDFLGLLKGLTSVRLTRFFLHTEFESAELHGFCDSSSEVYCAVVFLRLVTSTDVYVNFVCTKTKVALTKVKVFIYS